jgi:Uncharacterised protein family (UPF0104).
VAGPVFKYGLLVAILVWFFTSGRLRFDLFALSEHFLFPLCIAGALLLVSMLCAGLRYGVALRAVEVPCGLGPAVKAGFTGFFFTYCSMGTLSGDVMRWVYINRVCPGAGERVTAAVVGDRLMGLLSLVTLCGFALVLGMELSMPPSLRVALGGAFLVFLFCFAGVVGLLVYRLVGSPGIVLAALVLGGMVIYMSRGLADETVLLMGVGLLAPSLACVGLGLLCALMASRLSPDTLGDYRFAAPGTVGGKVVGMAMTLLSFKDSPRILSVLLVFAMCQHLAAVFAITQLAQVLALPDYPSLAQAFFAAPLTFMINIAPLPGAGIGVNEVAFGALLAVSAPVLGPALAGGVNVYLLFRLIMTCLSFIGVPYYIGLKKT